MLIIDPRSNFAYSSFYIYGLIKLFGQNSISYSMTPFSGLGQIGKNMRFVYINGKSEQKVYIHTDDDFHLHTECYDWCDVYGCVNANFAHYPKAEYPKLVSLVPSFGIVPYGMLQCILTTTSVLLKSFRSVWNYSEWNENAHAMVVRPLQNIKHLYGRNIKNIKNRMPYDAYSPGQTDDDYIFFLSTLWYSNDENNNDKEVNLRRAHFIRACKSLADEKGVSFEGGFANRSTSKTADLFSDCLVDSVSMTEWMEKTKRSALVFNTPAFWNCHGWKLGEYLALGKCIISTKLSNDLPAPLIHGVHIHYVENTQEAMKEAIEFILSHPDYRHKLEIGARAYWEQYGTPEASLKLLEI